MRAPHHIYIISMLNKLENHLESYQKLRWTHEKQNLEENFKTNVFFMCGKNVRT